MTEAEALDQLKLHSEPDRPPQLTNTELQKVLINYALDAGGYDSEGVLKAIADAWDLKTNKASDHHDFSVNGRGLSMDQIYTHCKLQADKYRRRIPVHVA